MGEGHEDDNGGLNIIEITLAATITVTIPTRQGRIVEYIRPTRDAVILTVDGKCTGGGGNAFKAPLCPTKLASRLALIE
jgi:hypothetical protein